jgi:hypothetical protein
MYPHIALLGDSVFDNRAYTKGAPDVITHLRRLMPREWTASLVAIDGSTAADLSDQLADVPADATHIVVSVGGNDALLNSDILDMPVTSTAQALEIFGQRRSAFESAYSAVIDAALRQNRPTTVCTIYNGNFSDEQARINRVALTIFNDVIFRVAFARGLSVIDLGLICTEPSDYANPIEPSDTGGKKIAEAILATLEPQDASDSYSSRVFAGSRGGRRQALDGTSSSS